MKADSRTEAEVMAVLERVGAAYREREMNDLLTLFAPDSDLVMYGTGMDEKRVGLDEVKRQAERDWSQTDNAAIEWGWHSISAAGPVAWVASDATFNIRSNGEMMSVPVRVTSVLERRDDRWLIVQAHFSAPMAGQDEGQSF